MAWRRIRGELGDEQKEEQKEKENKSKNPLSDYIKTVEKETTEEEEKQANAGGDLEEGNSLVEEWSKYTMVHRKIVQFKKGMGSQLETSRICQVEVVLGRILHGVQAVLDIQLSYVIGKEGSELRFYFFGLKRRGWFFCCA